MIVRYVPIVLYSTQSVLIIQPLETLRDQSSPFSSPHQPRHARPRQALMRGTENGERETGKGKREKEKGKRKRDVICGQLSG